MRRPAHWLQFLAALSLGAQSTPVLAAAGGPPAQPDLDVTYISITPRPPSYYPNYDTGYPRPTDPNTNQVISIEQAQAIEHYHKPGEMVTLTAHVVNHGGLASAPYNWAWKVDGATIASGREDAGLAANATPTVQSSYTMKGFWGSANGYTFRTWDLAPGTSKDFSVQWPWQDGAHKVRFEVTPDASNPAEISQYNNAREDWTDAAAFFITVRVGDSTSGYTGFSYVRNFTDDGLHGYPKGAGSYSFEDWLQYHVDLMHDKFAKSIWPASPNGILQHVRIDQILILRDEEGEEGPGPGGMLRAVNGFDSSWPFGRYPAANAQVKDWGLIHEWGHQIGLIDIYNLDSIPTENMARDIDGYPTGLGRTAHQEGMMRGHGDTTFSEFDAIGMNTQLGRRRGYYGDFQYLLPSRNRIRVLDNTGNPVPNAEVLVYQSKPFPSTPTFTGTTDADGYYDIPNRPSPHNTTETKPGEQVYTQPDNPFGNVDVVGPRSVFLFRVRSGEKREFFFLDITDFVRAWALQGPNDAVYPFYTHFAPPTAPPAPAGLTAQLNGSSVSLTWQPPPGVPSDQILGYRLYRGVEQEYIWQTVQKIGATVTSTTDSAGDRRMVRYAVTAMTAAGQTGFSNEVGIYTWGDMRGLAVQQDGTIMVADWPREQPIWLRPDGSPIQIFGSVHNHVAAIDVAYTPWSPISGNGAVAYVGNPASYVDIPCAGIFVLTTDGTNRFTDGTIDNRFAGFRPNGSGWRQWQTPEGVAPQNDGKWLVTDSANHRVVVTDERGVNDLSVFGADNLTRPIKSIQLPDGRILVTDQGASRIAVFDSGYGYQGTFASLAGPTYIARAPDGTLAVAQTGSNQITLLTPDGAQKSVLTAAPDSMLLRAPKGLAFNASGDLLVADSGTRRVVKFALGAVTPNGDVDGNGGLELADVRLALRIAAGLTAADSGQVARGDLAAGSGPRALTVEDAIQILQKVPKKVPPWDGQAPSAR